MTEKTSEVKMVEKSSEAKTLTVSDKIWAEIQNLPIEMFALPGQVVRQHTQRFLASPDAVYLKLQSPAVVVSLEATLASFGKRYAMEVAEGGYVVVKYAPPEVVVPKTIKK
jgi:hypothetical protein